MTDNKYFVPIVFWIILLLAVAGFMSGFFYIKEPEPKTASTSFSENCTFYKKVTGGDMVISEPAAGTYRYEVYATSDGIEVYKCSY